MSRNIRHKIIIICKVLDEIGLPRIDLSRVKSDGSDKILCSTFRFSRQAHNVNIKKPKTRDELLREQQQAISLITKKVGSIEAAAGIIGVSPESLFNWRSGRHIAQGLTRRKLLKKVNELSALGAASGVDDLSARGGSRTKNKKDRRKLREKLFEMQLEPPAVRARTVSQILADSKLSQKQLAGRLAVHVNTLRDYLNTEYTSLMKLSTARKIEHLKKQLEKTDPEEDQAAVRLTKALEKLLGAKLVEEGFEKRDHRRIKVAEELSRATGLHTRTIRRHLPLIDFKKRRRFSPHVVEAFEKAAAELGNIVAD